MKLDQLCIISDNKSVRYAELQGELEILTRFVFFNNINYIYKYDYKTLTDYDRSMFSTNAIDRIIRLNYSEGQITDRSLAVCLNHLEALTKIGFDSDPNLWSIICEDDIYIANKSSFENELCDLTALPNDAGIVWISSGKKPLDSTFRDVTGFDYVDCPKPVGRYVNIQRSRYADCILIKNETAKFIANKFIEHKFATPIDWEYNYLFSLYPQIISYWMMPALIQQNPKFF